MLSLRGTLVPKQPFPHLLKYPVNTYHIHTVIIFAFFKYTFFTEGNIWHKNNIFFANRSPPLWLADKYRAINGDYRGAYGCGNVNRSCAWSHHYIELFYNTCKFFNPVIADIFFSLSLYAADYPIQQFFLSGTCRNKNSSTCFPDYLVCQFCVSLRFPVPCRPATSRVDTHNWIDDLLKNIFYLFF